MTEPTLKDQGNEEFKKGNWMKAAVLYTKAIKEDPENAVLYSNRCAALLKMNKVSKALADADQCIKLKPEWDKGYFRKGSVHEVVEQYKEALEAFQQAHQKNPDNAEVAQKIRTLQKLIKSRDKQPGSTADTAAARVRTT